MKKSKLLAGLALTVFALGTAVPASAFVFRSSGQAVYRLYNKNTGEHFYTRDSNELVSLQEAGWASEGIGWYMAPSGEPVYRIYNPNAKGGDHYYTMSKGEAEYNVSLGWKWDNDAKPVFYSGGAVPNYVAFNPNAKSGSHNYTTNAGEQTSLLRSGWTYGVVSWYSIAAGTDQVDPYQVAEGDFTSIQGLWRDEKGQILKVIDDKFILDGKALVIPLTEQGKEGEFGIGTFGKGFSRGVFVLWPDTKLTENPADSLKSDLSKARIFIGQNPKSGSYFYKVGQS